MVKFLKWLSEIDWSYVLEWIGGVILILGIIGMIAGGGEGGDGFNGI